MYFYEPINQNVSYKINHRLTGQPLCKYASYAPGCIRKPFHSKSSKLMFNASTLYKFSNTGSMPKNAFGSKQNAHRVTTPIKYSTNLSAFHSTDFFVVSMSSQAKANLFLVLSTSAVYNWNCNRQFRKLK